MRFVTGARLGSGRGAEGDGGSGFTDPPVRHALVRTAVPALAGAGLLVPFARDGGFSPVLAWFLAALNIVVIVGAISALVAARRRSPGNPGETPQPAPRPAPMPRTHAQMQPRTVPRPRQPQQRAVPQAPRPQRPAGPDRELLARLADPDPFLRMSAVAAMRGRMECEGVLVKALHDRYPMVRREVVRALRTTGSSFATETLIKVAAHDPSAEVREEAVAALGALLRERRPEEGPR